MIRSLLALPAIAVSVVVGVGCAGVFAPPPRSVHYRPRALCQPASGAPGAAAREESLDIARETLTRAFMAIADEHPEEHRQQIERTRVPLQRFPRLTFPALLDPEKTRGARRSESWFFPLILAQEQIGDLPADDLQSELRFWLVRHGREVETETWTDVTDCLVRAPGSSDRIFSASSAPGSRISGADELLKIALLEFPTLALGEDLRGLVFELPTRLAPPSESVAPGFYDLKALPRLGALRDLALSTPSLAGVAARLLEGDWPGAVRASHALSVAALSTPEAVQDVRAIAAGLDRGHPASNFAPDLRDLSRHLKRLARALGTLASDRSSTRGRRKAELDAELELGRVERAMRVALVSLRSLAPVALRDPAREPVRCGGKSCVRFAIAGDLQYHRDVTSLLRFLARFDPDVVQPGSAELSDASRRPLDVDFVLIAGDVADSAASTAKGELALNFLGLLPPASPYSEDGGQEMSDVRDVLARFHEPFFAVPGNHDGYAGFGGLLNVVIDEFGNLVRTGLGPIRRSWGQAAAAGIKSVNDYVPTLVGWRLLSRMPRYDGLNEFQNYLGTLNLAFTFRGHSFIGVNSYDLTAKERAAIGGVVLNWGGALQDESLDWIEDVLNEFSPAAHGGQQVMFMHQDPRAAVPQHSSYRESWFGIYDPTDSYVSRYTFGHFGLGNSPETGLYLPVVTPFVSYFFRAGEIGWGEDAGVWQQEWMRKIDMPSLFDQSVYNGHGLIDVINCNLAGRKPGTAKAAIPAPLDPERCKNPRGWLTDVAFAHDNVPIEERWVDRTQRGAVFREGSQEWGDWTFSAFSYLSQFAGAKLRNGSPPKWAKRMRLGEDAGNARVLRLDDVGQLGDAHGFHLVTLYADGRQEIEWVGLPR